MKIAVVGLWHLGCVTAACLASKGHEVIGFDPEEKVINQLKNGRAPIFEPQLDDLIQATQKQKTLQFTSNIKDIAQAELVWIAYDTPVDDHDQADVNFVIEKIAECFPHLANNAMMLISSQIPVGSTYQIQAMFREQYPNKNVSFAYSPENLRLGKAIEVFTQPDRVVIGIDSEKDKQKLNQVFEKITQNIVWMKVESAEMTKHALNAFLATSVTFINELSGLCEQVGADAKEVEAGLKSEMRIGQKAYLRPGSAFAGGTLARDVSYLIDIGERNNFPTAIFPAILESNHQHKQWACRRITEVMGDVKQKTIAVLGLTYKVGTDTLRRSTAIETCQWLKEQGAKIAAYDPAIKELPQNLTSMIDLKQSPQEALKNADAVIVSTEWPEFTALNANDFVTHLKQPLIFDASGFLNKSIGADNRIRHFTVGRIA